MNYVIKNKIKNVNKTLEKRLTEISHNSRFIYNYQLGLFIKKFNNDSYTFTQAAREARNEYRKHVRNEVVTNQLTGEIYDKSFQNSLKNTPSQISDMTCQDLKRSLKMLYKNVKKSNKIPSEKKFIFNKNQLPSFKKRTRTHLSFTIQRKNSSNFKIINNKLKVVKIDQLINIPFNKLKFNLNNYDIKRITFKKEAYGWYISILIDIDKNKLLKQPTHKQIGIDWGIESFASDSDGNQFKFNQHPGYENYIKLEKKLKKLESIRGKKRNKNPEWYKSNIYKKLSKKISKIYKKMSNIRKDFIHKVSKYYIENYDLIVIEDLKISNMLKNHKLAKAISEKMFYTWKVLLEYKCKFYGRKLKLVDPKNTSQKCNKCGTKVKDKLKLSQRTFKCDNCGYEENRDINAAKNILSLA
jgi:putative transposase